MLARVVNDTNQGLFQIFKTNSTNYNIPFLCDAVICCIEPIQTGLQAFTVVLTPEFINTYIEYNGSRGIINFSSNTELKITYLSISANGSFRTIIAFPS